MSNLKIRDDSANYTATVIKLPVKQAITGLDKLVQVEVYGNTCLVGKDSDPTVLYLYFPAGTKLSQRFLTCNDLYRDAQMNAHPDQKPGFFEPNGKIKGLKLKGIVSNGFVIPLASLELMLPYSEGGDISELEIGNEFNEWCGFEVCRKYFVPRPEQRAAGEKQPKINNKLANLMIPNQFRFHGDTAILAKNLHQFQPSDILVITDKWHGSSCILSKVLINVKLTKWQKWWNKWIPLPKFTDRIFGYHYSSGKPKSNLVKGIVGVYENDGPDYYSNNIWKNAYEQYKDNIEDGISLYGELVGFVATKSEPGAISIPAYIQKLYDYGCSVDIDNAPLTRFVIYRITYTKPNGEFIEFSWQQIKDYCAKYSLETVPELYFGKADHFVGHIADGVKIDLEYWQQTLFNDIVKTYIREQDCVHCNNKVAAEGVVIRRDGHLNKYDVYKVKSKRFVFGETNETESNIEDEQ